VLLKAIDSIVADVFAILYVPSSCTYSVHISLVLCLNSRFVIALAFLTVNETTWYSYSRIWYYFMLVTFHLTEIMFLR
jgi:hypothetical protein